ncbi:MAG: polysaccharide biosynthesis protein [Erysipelotrichaceae bacterium]|nr:MAG: polysaccharide biosynthesis protein [Erysipelotrichaceae bacterium]
MDWPKKLIMIVDLFLVALSYFIGVWIRMDLSFMILTYYNAFYSNLWLILASVSEAISVLLAALTGAMVTYISLYLLNFEPVPRSIFLIQIFVLILLLEFVRFSYRTYSMLQLKMQSYSSEDARTLIYGAGAAGVMILKEITTNKVFKNRIIGFVDDDASKVGKTINGIKILGTTDDLIGIVNSQQIELIYVAMPSVTLSEQKKIIQKCYETRCKVMVLTSTQDMISARGFKRSLREIDIEDLLGRESIRLDNSIIREHVTGKVILVSGAAGSIGSELCRQIIQHAPKILLMVDINENGLYDLQQEFNMRKQEGSISKDIIYIPIITSVRDVNALERVFDMYHPEIVIHAAAHKHVPLMEEVPIEAIKNNIFGSYNLIQTAEKFKVERFLSISTDKAVNPTNVMGATKGFVEKIIRSKEKSSTKFVAVRFGNVLGSNGSIIPLFKKQIENGGPLTLTDRNVIRYFMTIPEAVSLVLQAMTYGKGGEIFVLDMGEPVKILDLAENMIRLAGFIPHQDIQIKEIGLRPGEKLYEEIHLEEENVSQTENKLIFVAHPIPVSVDQVKSELAQLSDVISNPNIKDDDVIQLLTKVVENYTPNRGGNEDVSLY